MLTTFGQARTARMGDKLSSVTAINARQLATLEKENKKAFVTETWVESPIVCSSSEGSARREHNLAELLSH